MADSTICFMALPCPTAFRTALGLDCRAHSGRHVCRERMVDTMFRRYGFAGVQVQIQAVLTLYSQGALTHLSPLKRLGVGLPAHGFREQSLACGTSYHSRVS